MASPITDLAKRFSSIGSAGIGSEIDKLVGQAIIQRRGHERRWYDNNFFDDGYHFRVISKKTGRVIDHVNRNEGYIERAIPRASRQIRGVVNLLLAPEPYPVIYPEDISKESYPDVPTIQQDPQTGQPVQVMTENPAYQQALDQAKDNARKQGLWLSTQWEDEQDLTIKLVDALVLAAKHSLSWIQVSSDPNTQKITTEVFDAFDVVVWGDRRSAHDLPFITKIKSMDFKEVLANPMFDPKMVAKLSPDNQYATSEIKNAYMRARFGSKLTSKEESTILVKESFIKEIINQDNQKRAVRLSKQTGATDGKTMGDTIMRHVFSAGGVTLLDEYVDYDEYPLVPIRFEPGTLYQVPLIERFIPQNKSLDIIMTRVEKWVNAMIVGVYQKRKGENFQISNFPGGQVVEYETTPLSQMQNGTVGQTPFTVIELLDKYMDEQGATTSSGINAPQGIKSGVAIESIKSTEYANLKVATLMLKKSIKEIAERMLERAHKDILEPQKVDSVEDGEPNSFNVIGKRGFDLSQQVGKELPSDTVVLDKDVKVKIEIEPGLGLTMDGKRQSMQEIINYMIQLSQANPDFIPQDALKQIIKRFLETFGYGSTQEFMEALDDAKDQGSMSDPAIKKMQLAMLQVLKDSGVADMANRPEKPKTLAESLSIAFKDLPEDTKAAVIQALGFPAPQENSPEGEKQLNTKADTANKIKEHVQPSEIPVQGTSQQ